MNILKRHWARLIFYSVAVVLLWPLAAPVVNSAIGDNGFDLTGATIPVEEIYHGGPPRDGIPALTGPKLIPSTEADYLAANDRVIGIELDGERRAYPIRILNYHEIVNDRIGEKAIVITYCPLCGTGMGFLAKVAGSERVFGVSGLLYNSDMLLYDQQSESLWSQLMERAVSGSLTGTKLKSLPVQHTTWKAWQKGGESRVLSLRTGHQRDYSRSPYGDYDSQSATYFPISSRSNLYHPKERVLGVELAGRFVAYPFSELAHGPSPLINEVAGNMLTIRFDAASRSGQVFNEKGDELPVVNAFWFAWYTFHPETIIYQSE